MRRVILYVVGWIQLIYTVQPQCHENIVHTKQIGRGSTD